MSEPDLSVPDTLPIAAARADIEAALRAFQVVIVCGDTGSGKSTQLPKIALGLAPTGLIGHTQPRRIAARSLAARIAAEIGDEARALVGYQVRFSDRTGPATRIKLMTDGILLAELAHDRALRRYATLILDEAHERSLNIDFLLGLARGLLPQRPELKLIVASATLDPDKLARHFDGAPVIEVSGRGYPIELRYRSPAEAEPDPQRALVAAAHEIAASAPGRAGDTLVFLPGEREIRETAQALRKHGPKGVTLLPLYARLSAAEQDRVFERSPGRRIVLATNVAETSLTVPGVTAVIDTGLARVSRYGHRSKIQRLPVEAISRASADQRKGRCGRVAAGLCIRLYSEADYAARPAFTDPEILRTNLASVILRMAQLGLGAIEDFPFPDAPDPRLVRDGYRLLRELGAVDDARQITSLGRRMARLPVDPRLARILLAAPQHGCLAEALVLAAVLSIPDPRERPADAAAAADARHAALGDPSSDFIGYLRLWQAYQAQRQHASSRQQARWCREQYLSFMRMREWHDLHQELRGLLHDMGVREQAVAASADAVHRAVLTGFIDRIGWRELRRTDRARYTGARGLRFNIFPGSSVQGTPRWIVAASLIETSSSFAMTVGRVRRRWLEEAGAALLKRSYQGPHWRTASGRVEAFEQCTLYGLLLYVKRRVDFGLVDPSAAHLIFISEALVAGRLGVRAPFLAHNRALEREVLALEAQLRRRDLLATPAQRATFYAARVPASISDRHEFERWRREAEQADPRRLYMTRDDALGSDAPAYSSADYPASFELAGNELELGYRFDPSDAHDGVTLTVPVALLGELGQGMLDALVPAWLADKIEALLWSLPKSLRRTLPTTKPLAQALAADLRKDGRPLTQALPEAIQARTGVRLPAEALREEAAPEHLRPLLRVVDGQGRVLAEARDLAALQARLAPQGQRRLAEPQWEREGLTRFEIDSLPESVVVRAGGLRLRAYPALEDGGSSVSLRLLRTAPAAQRASRDGLARLYALALPQQATWIRERVIQDPKIALLVQGLQPPASLADQLMLAVFAQVFLPPQAAPLRARAEFEARLARGRAEVVDAAARPLAALRCSLELRRTLLARCAAAPAAWVQAIADVRTQLDALVYPDFLRDLPAAQLLELPRYLEAIALRLDKLRDGPARDAALAAQIRPHWTRYRELPEAVRAQAPAQSELTRYRWMIEELRVSLYAQILGTRERVSPQRLDKQWERVRAELRNNAAPA